MKWHGQFRILVSRWPKKTYQWTQHDRRRRGRPQLSWKNKVTDFSRNRKMEGDLAEYRHPWIAIS